MPLVDVAETTPGFPARFMAAYLTNQAEEMRNPVAAVAPLRIATQLYAMPYAYDDAPVPEDAVFEAMTGSNAYPWFLLSEALAITEGDASPIEALEEATARAPYFAETMKPEQSQTRISRYDCGPIGRTWIHGRSRPRAGALSGLDGAVSLCFTGEWRAAMALRRHM
jgi:hypothetical protein